MDGRSAAGARPMVAGRRFGLATAASVALLVAGCGGSHSSPQTPAGKLERVPGNPAGQIVLSQVGAQRIGLQTAPAERAAGPAARHANVVVPASAIVYDVSGQTYAFKQLASLRYQEVPVKVDHIRNNDAYLVRGPAPGTPIVSIGAEELYGVQTGVLAQT